MMNNNERIDLIKDVLDISYGLHLGHIPSALSQVEYLMDMFEYVDYVKKNFRIKTNIILGKPFGAQAYYAIWKKLGYVSDSDIKNFSAGVKCKECKFVTFSEETIGNALGVAIGVALADPENITYCNLSDASLQMGATQEALLFLFQHSKELGNLVITIDYNNSQVLGKCSDIVNVKPVLKMISDSSYPNPGCKDFDYIDNTNTLNFDILNYEILSEQKFTKYPKIFIMHTLKGKSISDTQKPEWHYRKISSLDELNSLKEKII